MNRIRIYIKWMKIVLILGYISVVVLKISELYLISILIVLIMWGLEFIYFKKEQKHIKLNSIYLFQKIEEDCWELYVFTCVLMGFGFPLIEWMISEVSIDRLFISIIFLYSGSMVYFFHNQIGRMIIISDCGITFGYMNRFIAWGKLSSITYDSDLLILNKKSGIFKKIKINLALFVNKEMILQSIKSRLKVNVVEETL